jgi:hypothetical protein
MSLVQDAFDEIQRARILLGHTDIAKGQASLHDEIDMQLRKAQRILVRISQANVLATHRGAKIDETAPILLFTTEDGTTGECALATFLKAHTFTEEEERAFYAGDIVTIGGGAAPLVKLQLKKK